MATLRYTVIDGDFPLGTENETATLVTGQDEALLAGAGSTRAEDDLEVTHSNLHLTPGDRGMAVADLWRLEDGMIVEHWDVVQEVPEESANGNTMF